MCGFTFIQYVKINCCHYFLQCSKMFRIIMKLSMSFLCVSLTFLTEWLIHNVVLVSGVQKVIQLYVLFSSYFPL